MIVHVLAVDYDGTIAEHGRVSADTATALARVRASGRRCVLVTGRRLPDLRAVCPDIDAMFDGVVAENGALLYLPALGEVQALGHAPEPGLVDALRRRSVRHEVGAAIVATSAEHAEAVREALRESGAARVPILNKGALMLLPDGVTKGTGLAAALEVMEFSPHNVVGVGDAENDEPLLAHCECAVAVADAVPALRERADHVTRAGAGAGVVELVEEHLLGDAVEIVPRLRRHQLALGHTAAGARVTVAAHATGLLVVGPPASGTSALAGLLVERLVEADRAFCVLDPGGDHRTLGELDGVSVLGGAGRPALPRESELDRVLRRPSGRLVLDLGELPMGDRVAYAAGVLAAATATRRASGLPHWLLVDEADQIAGAIGDLALPAGESLALLTRSADRIVPSARRAVRTVVSTDADALREALAALGGNGPPSSLALPRGDALLAALGEGPARITRFTPDRRRIGRRRHVTAHGCAPTPDRHVHGRDAGDEGG